MDDASPVTIMIDRYDPVVINYGSLSHVFKAFYPSPILPNVTWQKTPKRYI